MRAWTEVLRLIAATLICQAGGALMIPYVLWVSLASVLNFSLQWLNRG